MDDTRPIIRSACLLFACRLCRTKTLWPHQSWCAASRVTRPACPDCCYYDPAGMRCTHPARGRGRASE